MTRYAVLLRGINVGGVRIPMRDLADVVRSRGFTGVRTVLASGNVLLESDLSADAVKAELESALRERFGYEAWVHVLPLPELEAIAAAYPFERDREGWHDYVIVVVDEATRVELLAAASDSDPEVELAAPGAGVVYWTVERGRTVDSVLGAALGRATYRRWVTTRNLRTIDRLLR